MQMVVGDAIGVSQPTVSTILPRVCGAIVTRRQQYISMPETAIECYRTSCDFARIARLPNIIGAIDCTHIRINRLVVDSERCIEIAKATLALTCKLYRTPI